MNLPPIFAYEVDFLGPLEKGDPLHGHLAGRINVHMHVTLIDDSIAFDGYSPSHRPLGGSEKAFASLPLALFRRGHTVTVINRCQTHLTAEGVSWMPWDAPRPSETDVLIAFRKPTLLGALPAEYRILWLSAPAGYLNKRANREVLEYHRPKLVFMGDTHRATWNGASELACAVIQPGVREAYRSHDEESVPASPPTAVVTTHPVRGLDRLLATWAKRIHSEVPEARLRGYSSVLDRGRLGGDVPDGVRPVLDAALALKGQGVEIERPKADFEMAGDYRAARVHLYPAMETELYCATLAESQACGLPAVARPGGAVAERIVEGLTGYVAPDEDAFVNVAVDILLDDETYNALNREAKSLRGKRGWDAAAVEFEELWQ